MAPPKPFGGSLKSLRVLIVGGDRTLEDEFRTALAGVPDAHAVSYFATSDRQVLEIVRGRQPDLVVIEIDREVEGIAGLSKEIHELLPSVAIAAAFRPDRLEEHQSESATIIELLRARVREFLRRPLSATELRVVLDRLLSEAQGVTPAAAGRMASFVSNKGGVGKSTLAVNVACGLARRFPDDEVLLVDLSLQLGTCALMLDISPATTILDAVHERERLDETLLRHLTIRHASGLRLLAAPDDAVEAAEIDDEAVSRVLTMARRRFKYILVDTFPVLDSVVMAVLDLSDLAFVVAQTTAPSIAGLARFLPVLEGLGVSASRQRIVVNHNYKRFLGDLRLGDIAARLQRPPDYSLPYEKGVLISMNTGSPQILHATRWNRFGRAISDIVNDLVDGVDAAALARRATSGDRQEWSGADRRTGGDRRVRDLGRIQGDRRSGLDRRLRQGDRAAQAREVVQ
jgi:pilus assembly protein CpaE